MKIWNKLCVMVLAICLAAGMSNTAMAAVKLNKTNVKMEKGDMITLKLKGKHGKVSWRSSNKKVAVVSSKGKVIAKKKGKAVVSAAANGKTYKCRVTVKRAGATVAHAHYYEEEITKEPTCQEDGEKTFTCECGDSYTVDIPAIDHSGKDKNATAVKTVAPSKAGHGYTLYHCNVCGKDFEDDRVDYNPTEEQVYNDLMALQAEFPTGMKWDESNKYNTPYSNFVFNGIACGSFALMISDRVFGDLPYRNVLQSFPDLKVGDIITTVSPSNHAMVVLKANQEAIVVVEGNNNGKVCWMRSIRLSDIVIDGVFRRYPV